jgi:hypothetical protein
LQSTLCGGQYLVKRAKSKNDWSLGDGIRLFLTMVLLFYLETSLWLVNPTTWPLPSLSKLDIPGGSGPEAHRLHFTLTFAMLVEVCCVTFLEDPVSHLFGYLFSKVLPCLPYIGEKKTLHVIIYSSSVLRCLLLRMLSYILIN